MTSYRDLVERARSRITELAPVELKDRLDQVVVIDVREPDEHSQGAIPNARFLSRGLLERDIASMIPDPSTPLVLYCSGGSRS
ncbi:MAG: rhodanese-like domain-containing protein, partial [Acidimicrobiia bacterium]